MNDTLYDEARLRGDALAKDLPLWRLRNAYYHRLQRRYFKFLIPPGKRVLEIGCGRGDLLAALAPAYGLGIDLSPVMVSLARRTHGSNPRLNFAEFAAEWLSLKDPFDYIVLSDTVGSLVDIEEALRRLRPCCTDATRVVISYYNFLWEPALKLAEWLRLKMPERNANWLSPDDVRNLLGLAGFEIVKTERRVLLPKNIPLIAPLANRYLATLPLFSRLCLNFYVVARRLPETPPVERSVSIVVPCRNERGNIAGAVKRLPVFGTRQEILFVDGRSEDGTLEEIRRVAATHPDRDIKVLVQIGLGKGDAVRQGFAAAGGDVLMILDADLTVPPEDLPKFYRALVTGKGEFINGSRLVYPLEKEAMRILNLFGNKFFSLVFTWILGQRFKDTLCGTKVLFREDYEALAANRAYFGDFDPFGDFDLIFGAAKMNLRIVEVPIRYRERTYGRTNISRFKHGWLLLKMCVYAFRKLKAM